MDLSALLVIIALILVIVAVVTWERRGYLLLATSIGLVCVALLVGGHTALG